MVEGLELPGLSQPLVAQDSRVAEHPAEHLRALWQLGHGERQEKKEGKAAALLKGAIVFAFGGNL